MKTTEAQGCDGDPDKDVALAPGSPPTGGGGRGQPTTVPRTGVQRGSQRREAVPRLSQTFQLT